MNIENINMWLTIISIIVTIISIVCAIISIIQAKNAKKDAEQAKTYKDQIKDVLNTVDLMDVSREFARVSQKFISDTTYSDWYKGNDPSRIVDPMREVLFKLPSIYNLVENTYRLKKIIENINSSLMGYEDADQKVRKKISDNIFEIQEILQEAVNIQQNKL